MKHYKSNIINILVVLFLAFFVLLPFNIAQAGKSPIKIRVGIFQNKPIVFQDELGKPQGLYVDLLNEVAKYNNWQLEYVFDSWTNGLERLKKNDITLMTSIASTKERDSYIDFSQENILTMWGQVYVGKKSSVQNILDIEGLRVAILRDGINGINFQKLCKAFDIRCQLIVKDTYEDAVKLVGMGKADACVINNVHGYELEKEYEIRKSPIMFNPFKLLFAVPEGKHGDILKTLDKQLKDWKQHEDSFYYQALYHWYGGKISSQKVIPQWLIYSLILSIGIISLSLVWIKALQYQIRGRRKAERALRESEEHLQSVFRAAPTGIGVVINRALKQVNERICEMTGYSEEELIGQNARILYPSENEYEHVGREKYEQIRDHGTGTVETHWKRKDGRIIDVLLSSTPIDLSDLLKGVTFTALDITKRKQAEEALRVSEEHLHRLLQNIQAAVIVHGPDTKILKCNKLSQDLLGLTEDQMLGKKAIHPSWRFFNEDGSDMPLERYPVNRVIDTKNVLRDVIVGVYRPDKNDIVKVLVNAVPEIDHDGNITQVIVTFMDITEHRRVEEEMRVLSKFPSENPNPVLRVGKDGTILYDNKASTTLLKIWKCQLGQRVPDIWCEFILDTLNSGESREAEIKHTDRITALSFTPVSDAGYVNIYGQDITERKRAEAERENLIDELQEALKEVKALRGILPLCSFCKKIRGDKGYWEQVDVYIQEHSQADISHGICPECAKEHYPDLEIYDD